MRGSNAEKSLANARVFAKVPRLDLFDTKDLMVAGLDIHQKGRCWRYTRATSKVSGDFLDHEAIF